MKAKKAIIRFFKEPPEPEQDIYNIDFLEANEDITSQEQGFMLGYLLAAY